MISRVPPLLAVRFGFGPHQGQTINVLASPNERARAAFLFTHNGTRYAARLMIDNTWSAHPATYVQADEPANP